MAKHGSMGKGRPWWPVAAGILGVAAGGVVAARRRAAARRGNPLYDVRRLSEDLEALLAPHLAAEEEVLTPVHLAEMVPASAIGEIERQGRKLFGSDPRMPLFFAHSLQPNEQTQVFGAAPWVFRRVVLPLMDGRRFSRFRSLAVSPALAP